MKAVRIACAWAFGRIAAACLRIGEIGTAAQARFRRKARN
jgi:hypothetical protein